MAYQFSSTSLVLGNPDLLQNIFEYFDLCNFHCILGRDSHLIRRRTRQSLLWAALTSRVFLEPAMNILWREMESILPLYLLLPALRKEPEEHEEEQDSESEFTLTGPLNGDDIQRMVFYARRIRSLHFHYEGDDHFNIRLGLSMAFFTRINQFNAFLSLRELMVDSDRLSKFQHTTLRTISLPNLEDLALLHQDFRSPEEESKTNSFLEALACKSHHIKTLVLKGNYTGFTFNLLSKISKIQNLTICFRNLPVISLSLLGQISSSMISLQSLKLELGAGSQFQNDLKNSDHVLQFTSLTNLVVHGHLQNVGKLLEVLHAPLLCHLSLTVKIPDQDFDACTSIRSFIPVKMIDKVQSFSVSSFYARLRIDFGSQISPLIIFEQLEELFLDVDTLHISTAHLAQFFNDNRYFSNLQHLRLRYFRPPEINQSLSIAALPLIANACPKLCSLEISIHHPDRSEMQILTQSGRSHTLRTLIFEALPAWDKSTSLATALSSFLVHLFPGLTDVHYGVWSHKKWWNDVRDKIKVLRSDARTRSESD